MGMVLTHCITDDTGALTMRLIRTVVQLYHGIKHTPLYGLKAVPDIRQGPGADNTHGIVDIGLFHGFLKVLQVLLHEGGHLVCGLATDYRFVSFRIFNLTFIRKDGKLCIKRFSLAGTGGQCLLTPPERPLEDIPTTLYNLGGVLANLLTAILAFLPLLTVDGLPYLLKFFLLMLSLIGILLAGMNGIPMKMGGIGNDADNMRLLLKDSKSKQALVTQLRINALVQEGMRPKDMPAEWFSQTEDINYKDALQVTIALMSASRLLDCEEWEAAYNAFMYCQPGRVLP